MRLVIKVGTSTLTHSTGKLNLKRFGDLCRVLSDLKNAGHEIVLVSSGAIATGVGKLSLPARPEDIPTKQAVAAVGQCELMFTYEKTFAEFGHTVAQILITGEDMQHAERHKNFENTVERLLEMGILPIINENDTVSTAEIALGDNDTLAALVAVGIKADLLVLLSDIDGLYTADPHKSDKAELIPVVERISDELFSLAGGAGSARGTGGMETKLGAAKTCTQSGIDMIIANGASPEILYGAVEGKSVGTRFKGAK